MSKLYQLVLCSKSPRRKELLTKAGYDFHVCVSNSKEVIPMGLNPYEQVIFLSKDKVEKTPYVLNHNTILIAADTMVFLDEKELGKPKDKKEAIKMLKLLSGKCHDVITGVTLCSSKKMHSFYSSTTVFIENMKEKEIVTYVEDYMPFDKAGSYGIQDSLSAKQEKIGPLNMKVISGDYYNVVGLPIGQLKIELEIFINK